MFVFDITTGDLTQDGAQLARGYSGNGPSMDDPSAQACPGIGPLPVGLYTIGIARKHPHLGPVAMPLTPDPSNVMYGRSGFWIHGDSIKHPGEGSHGCICLPRPARLAIATATDRRLTVIAVEKPPTA